MVGLWLSDHSHGQQNHSSGQQHLEQHPHLTSGTGGLYLDICLYMDPLFRLYECVVCYIQAMSSPEDKAYEIMRELDVSYVLVIFGGLTGYASDGESTCEAV